MNPAKRYVVHVPLRVAVTFVFIVIATPQAYAYIDPGTGSFVLQMLLAGFFTLLFMLKNLRTKVFNFVRSLFKKRSDDRPE